MADVKSSIFNKRATERLQSPDDLDRYVRVTNPSVWVLLIACVALLAGILAWGVFGSVTTSVSSTGTCVQGRTLCLLSAEDAAKVSTGDTANVGGVSMTVASVSEVPLSLDETRELLDSDYLAATLMSGDWAYVVTFDGDASAFSEGVPLPVSITTERIAPISLVLGG
jgi:hypothetical protein